ncbi:MAG: NAD-dependent epimerase/dehydratase family protein [Rhodothermales bacterium]|nr:NAD-dependent epimerase/dehydratase family protein [Rhodothermales bacterium]
MKVLVTGGAGFIGSHIVDALLDRNHEVHILDDLSSGFRDRVNPDAAFHELDIRSSEAADLVRAEGCEVMIHHAAQMDVRRSVADPSFDADVNVRGFLNIVEAGRTSGLRKVVFASTGGAIYGEPDFVPQDETHALNPISPYGITKLTTEKYLYFYLVQYGLQHVALRYANIYGPRQNPHGDAGVVAIFCQRLLKGDPVTIFGDGSQTRDYVYVGDVVEANLRAIEHSNSGVINIGTGVETSVNELYSILADHLGVSTPANFEPARPGEQKRSVLDNTLAATSLNWRPAVSIEEGLRKTADWFKNQMVLS